MTQGRRISAADRLADQVRTTIERALPMEARTELVQALGQFDRATGYTARLGRRQRRLRAKHASRVA